MSYIVRSKYTKPSAKVSLHTPPAELNNLINTMFDAGKITQKPVETIDGLNYTYEIIFRDVDAFNEYNNDPSVEINAAIRLNHCTENSISYSVEAGV